MLSCSPINSGGFLHRPLDGFPSLASGRCEQQVWRTAEHVGSQKRCSNGWARTSHWSRQRCCSSHARKADYIGDASQQRKSILLQYVSTVQPSVIEKFADKAPAPVVRAMQETVKNMVGTLPPQFFTVTISTMGDNLAQLMYSVLLTGYMFRNAQYRMELRNSYGAAAGALPGTAAPPPSLPSTTTASTTTSTSGPAGFLSTLANFRFGRSDSTTSSTSTSTSSPSDITPDAISPADIINSSSSTGGSGMPAGTGAALALTLSTAEEVDATADEDSSPYAPGVQKSNIDGQVLRWHKENGLERMSASQYIELLEQEVAALRQAARASAASAAPVRPAEPHAELLEYLRAQEGQGLQELTDGASPELTAAANAFIARLMGTSSHEALRGQASDCSAGELAKLLLWLLVVGYTLRSLEVRMDVSAAMEVPLSAASILELPPGQ